MIIADPSTVSSARSRIIGTLNKPIRRSTEIIEEALKADPSTVSSARSRIIGTLNKRWSINCFFCKISYHWDFEQTKLDITPTCLPIIANIEEAIRPES